MTKIKPGDLVEYAGEDRHALEGGPGRVVDVFEDSARVEVIHPCLVLGNEFQRGEILAFNASKLRVIDGDHASRRIAAWDYMVDLKNKIEACEPGVEQRRLISRFGDAAEEYVQVILGEDGGSK